MSGFDESLLDDADETVRVRFIVNGRKVVCEVAPRETLVDCDDERQRLVYAITSERLKQHSASVQVLAEDDAHCLVVWIADVLPHEIAPYMSAQMDLGAAAMQAALAKSAKEKNAA